MHVGYLTCEYPPMPSGGIGTSVRALARAVVRAGHRATVLGWGHDAHFDDEGVRVAMLPASPVPRMGWLANRVSMHRALKALAAHDGLDIVEAPDWCGPSAGLAPGCPIVIRCNGSALYFARLLGEPVRRSVVAAEWLALRRAAGVVAVSRFTASETHRLFRLPRPVGTIPNGIDPAQFAPVPPGAVERDVVLYAGTVTRKKGVLDLCRVFSRLVERRPSARLRVVGRDTPDPRTGSASFWAVCWSELSAAARERTDYLGARPHAEVREHLARAAVCAFPSHAEALPLVWLEAMACGRPVVAYDIGWAPEVVTSGRTGVLVARGDLGGMAHALARLLDAPDLADALGRAAREDVEARFGADRVAAQSLAWYARVLDAGVMPALAS
jgi:glycosyltransferase involved in cell wall biosynthesis